MIEYKPWSIEVVAEMAQKASEGVFACLDIEVSDKCPYNCIYCETPSQNRKSKVDIDKACALLRTKQFKWVYICGIGEPTYGDNENQLLQILECCKENGARCSIFTNLSNLSEKIIEYIEKGILYCIFKFDSQYTGIVDKLYNPSRLDEHMDNVQKMTTLVQCDGKTTNIAASIVPTQYNFGEIPDLVRWCIEHDIFPLVAQLEYTGAAKDVYEQLVLDDKTLSELKEDIAGVLGEEYRVPFCPAVFSGFSITYDNKIVVDHRTGLSCHSFWLDDPELDVVCSNFSDLETVQDFTDKLIKARVERYDRFLKNRAFYKYDILGGCGGNRKDVFDLYERMMKASLNLQEPENHNLKISRFTYLDNNATTQISKSVRNAMEPYLDKNYVNPNSSSQLGRSVRTAIDRARSQVAAALGSRPEEVYFTSCGSESNSWAIKCCLNNVSRVGRRIIISTEIEHESVLKCLSGIDQSRYKVKNIPIKESGEADIDSFIKDFSQWEDVCFASVMLVNNETGVINDIRKLAAVLREHEIPLHCDAVQAFGKMRINVNDLGVDYLSVSGHKIHAPKGIGALFIKEGSFVCPLIYGTQERNRRGGTENVAFIVAFGQAAKDAYSDQGASFEERMNSIESYRRRIEDAFSLSAYGAIINGKEARRVANTVNIGFANVDALRLSLLLESRGIYVSNGSACNTVNPQKSHVLEAMKSPAYKNGAIRISLSEYTQGRDIDYFIDNLRQSIKNIKGE